MLFTSYLSASRSNYDTSIGDEMAALNTASTYQIDESHFRNSRMPDFIQERRGLGGRDQHATYYAVDTSNPWPLLASRQVPAQPQSCWQKIMKPRIRGKDDIPQSRKLCKKSSCITYSKKAPALEPECGTFRDDPRRTQVTCSGQTAAARDALRILISTPDYDYECHASKCFSWLPFQQKERNKQSAQTGSQCQLEHEDIPSFRPSSPLSPLKPKSTPDRQPNTSREADKSTHLACTTPNNVWYQGTQAEDSDDDDDDDNNNDNDNDEISTHPTNLPFWNINNNISSRHRGGRNAFDKQRPTEETHPLLNYSPHNASDGSPLPIPIPIPTSEQKQKKKKKKNTSKWKPRSGGRKSCMQIHAEKKFPLSPVEEEEEEEEGVESLGSGLKLGLEGWVGGWDGTCHSHSSSSCGVGSGSGSGSRASTPEIMIATEQSVQSIELSVEERRELMEKRRRERECGAGGSNSGAEEGG